MSDDHGDDHDVAAASSSSAAASARHKKRKRKAVSARVRAKRRFEFEFKVVGSSSSKGEEEEAAGDPNPRWSAFYDELLGRQARVKLAAGLASSRLRAPVYTVFSRKSAPPASPGRALWHALQHNHNGDRWHALAAQASELPESATTIRVTEQLDRMAALALERELNLGRACERSALHMFAMRALDVRPGMACLDMSASGESLVLAELAAETGVLLCLAPGVNPVAHVRRANCVVAYAHVQDEVRVSSCQRRIVANLAFDRVLCPVPSTCDGDFHTKPKLWQAWKASNAVEISPLQLQCAVFAANQLSPGGVMCYCTKSLNPHENEAVVDKLVRASGGGLEVACAVRRVLPHEDGANGEGFCLALVRRPLTRKQAISWDESLLPTDEELSLARDVLGKLHGSPPPVPSQPTAAFAQLQSLAESKDREEVLVVGGFELPSPSSPFSSSAPRVIEMVVAKNAHLATAVTPRAWGVWKELPVAKHGRCGCPVAVAVASGSEGAWLPDYEGLRYLVSLLPTSAVLDVTGDAANAWMRAIASSGKDARLDLPESAAPTTTTNNNNNNLVIARCHPAPTAAAASSTSGKIRVSKAARRKMKVEPSNRIEGDRESAARSACLLVVLAVRGGDKTFAPAQTSLGDNVDEYLEACAADYFV